MRAVLGGKGANLAEMTNLGVPVPPGFTIACRACIDHLRDRAVPPPLREEVGRNLSRLEASTGKRLGDPNDPLLVSVRSGAPVSMPGMMETILNLGLNDRSVQGLARCSGNARFAYDSYRRFLQMYADVVLGVPAARFEQLLGAKRLTEGVETDAELSEARSHARVRSTRRSCATRRRALPDGAPRRSSGARSRPVWRSWTLKKAVDYRRVSGIPRDARHRRERGRDGLRQHGRDSGTGVAFTRDPSTGERRFYGEFLVNAQGEDVVAASARRSQIAQMADAVLPQAYAELLETQQRLESHFERCRTSSSTVERRKLYLLQTADRQALPSTAAVRHRRREWCARG
jgi:pyruvate,orthophosphate dikinase